MRRLEHAVGPLAVVAIIVACGGATVTPGPVPEWRSGTRLRPVVTTEGHVKRFSFFHDTTLGVDCRFTPMSDGALHCAPMETQVIEYSDAGCTQPMVVVSHCELPLARYYSSAFDPQARCGLPSVFEVGPSMVPAARYEVKAGVCTQSPVTADHDYFAVTRFLAPSELVSATESREARGARLMMSHLEGDDGSRQPYFIKDTAMGMGACSPRIASDGQLRCLPDDVALMGSDYAGPSCEPVATKQGFLHVETCNDPPTAVSMADPASCFRQYFEVGRNVPGPGYPSPQCNTAPYPVGPGATYWQRGPSIPDRDFALISYSITGGTSLVRKDPTVATGERLEAPLFWDSVHQAACDSQPTADGKTRCVPLNPNYEYSMIRYTDAACTSPVVGVFRCDLRGPFAWIYDDAADACHMGRVHVHSLGPIVPVSALYRQPGCVPDNSSTIPFRTLGPEITNELIELNDVME